LTGDEKEALGILVFDVTSSPASYIAEHSDVVSKFLAVTAAANAEWAANPSDAMLAVIAQEAGMDVESARSAIATMKFPIIEAQLSDAWLGANAAIFMKGVADVFVDSGSIDASLDNYEGAVNTGPLKAAAAM